MPRAVRSLVAIAALFCLLPAAAGCAPATRYRVLSFFFDGVPPPGGVPQPVAPGAARAPAPAPKAAYIEHAPYAKRQCQGCHDPATNNLRAAVPQLCFGCHKMGLAQKRYIHAPVVAGFCRLCHDPHGARQRFLLVSPPRELCFYCHNPEDVARNKAHENAEALCTECHETHADNRYFLRGATPPAPAGPAAPAGQAAPAPAAGAVP